MEYFARYSSPIGNLLLLSDGRALTGVQMDTGDARPGDADLVLTKAIAWLDAYFRGEDPEMDFPLAPKGTAFQRQVWEILLTIPCGKTITYGDIAREMAAKLGREKMSAQAVGGAVGRNPIGIVIPCHRVVGAGNALTGYAWGLDRKLWLLRHEGWNGTGKP